MKIIAFPFAGGSKYSFQKFSSQVADFKVIEYPGRGSRSNLNLINDIESLIEELFEQVVEQINSSNNYVIYGHSMGTLVAFLICHKIEKLKLKKPSRLIVSGCTPPSNNREQNIAHLSNIEFMNEVIKKGGIPDELLNYPELLDYFIPVLKSDFEAIENYNHVITTKLKIPIDVFYGDQEKISEDEIMQWQNETTEKVTITKLEGNHFFIYEHSDFIINYFNQL